MKTIIVQAFDNYISAHVAKGRLAEEGIEAWLADEHTVTIDPILTNAVGGIKLIVPELHAEKAIKILRQLKQAHQDSYPCPLCGSTNVELVSTPRKASNWASMLIGLFVTSYAMPVEKVNHCFDCRHEYPVKNATT